MYLSPSGNIRPPSRSLLYAGNMSWSLKCSMIIRSIGKISSVDLRLDVHAISFAGVCESKNTDSTPARGPQHFGARAAAEVVGQVWIADIARQHHAADAQRDQRERALARLRLVEMVLEHLDQLLHDLLVGGFDRLAAAFDLS